MSELVEVAKLADLAAGKAMTCEAGGRPIALFRTEDGVFALDNTCCHRGGPLGEGFLEGSVVTCPWHGWRFDVRTGVSPDNDAARVARHEVCVDGDSIRVRVGDAAG